MKLEDLVKAILAAQAGSAPAPDQKDTKANDLVQQLLAMLPTLLPLLLPLLVPLLQRLLTQPAAVIPPAPVIEPDDEEIPPPPGFEPPSPRAPVRGVIDVLEIQHPGHAIYYADKTIDDRPRLEPGPGQVIGDGSEFWARVEGDVPLNAQMKLGLSPTWYDAQKRELTGPEWDELWGAFNTKFWIRFTPDPDNPESVRTVSESCFFGDGTATTEVVASPKDAPANAGGARYRGPGGRNKGRAITIKLFGEGLVDLWAEMPNGQTTEPRRFVVR